MQGMLAASITRGALEPPGPKSMSGMQDVVPSFHVVAWALSMIAGYSALKWCHFISGLMIRKARNARRLH